MSSVFKKLVLLKNRYYPKVNLKIEIWRGYLKEEDAVYLLNYEVHCYVFLYLWKARIAYLADGTNRFSKDWEVSNHIRCLLGISIATCCFNQQFKVDYCGSSAVLIGIELVRSYFRKERPRLLLANKSWLKRITKTFHKEESSSVPNIEEIDKIQNLICKVCKKKFLQTKRKAYLLHIRFHNKSI